MLKWSRRMNKKWIQVYFEYKWKKIVERVFSSKILKGATRVKKSLSPHSAMFFMFSFVSSTLSMYKCMLYMQEVCWRASPSTNMCMDMDFSLQQFLPEKNGIYISESHERVVVLILISTRSLTVSYEKWMRNEVRLRDWIKSWIALHLSEFSLDINIMFFTLLVHSHLYVLQLVRWREKSKILKASRYI